MMPQLSEGGSPGPAAVFNHNITRLPWLGGRYLGLRLSLQVDRPGLKQGPKFY